jgi:SM-20-related protein
MLNMNSVKRAVFQLEGDDLELINTVRKKYVNTGLTYGWRSNNNKSYDQGHWNKLLITNSTRIPCDHNETPYLNNYPEVNKIWQIIQSVIGSRGFYRTYINGYTFGTEGYAHQDDSWIIKKYGESALSETAVIYLNPTWNIDWGGETVIYENLKTDESNEIVASVLPRMGKVFIFESKTLHASRPLSRACTVLRSVLVIKTIDPVIICPQMKFITALSSNVKHSGRSFFEHLFGTMLKLEDRKNKVSDEILLAGLYHSVYGTESFNYKNPDITRDVIRELIGPYSEHLVYEFCNMKNRMHTLINNTNEYDAKVLSDLITIELCNLADQNKNDNHDDRIDALETKLKELK